MVVKMKNGIKFLHRSAFLLLLSGVLWTTSCGGPKAEDGEGAEAASKGESSRRRKKWGGGFVIGEGAERGGKVSSALLPLEHCVGFPLKRKG